MDPIKYAEKRFLEKLFGRDFWGYLPHLMDFEPNCILLIPCSKQQHSAYLIEKPTKWNGRFLVYYTLIPNWSVMTIPMSTTPPSEFLIVLNMFKIGSILFF